jgi:hypothetical protein
MDYVLMCAEADSSQKTRPLQKGGDEEDRVAPRGMKEGALSTSTPAAAYFNARQQTGKDLKTQPCLSVSDSFLAPTHFT